MKKYLSIFILLFSSFSYGVTWCPAVLISDVICYSDGACFITTDGYSPENRYYKIDKDDVAKPLMVSIALSVYASNSKARFAFFGDNLDCKNIQLNTRVYGVGASKLY